MFNWNETFPNSLRRMTLEWKWTYIPLKVLWISATAAETRTFFSALWYNNSFSIKATSLCTSKEEEINQSSLLNGCYALQILEPLRDKIPRVYSQWGSKLGVVTFNLAPLVKRLAALMKDCNYGRWAVLHLDLSFISVVHCTSLKAKTDAEPVITNPDTVRIKIKSH